MAFSLMLGPGIQYFLNLPFHSSGPTQRVLIQAKKMYLVCFWVHWSPKYVLFGSYKRSKVLLWGSLCVFHNGFDRPLSPPPRVICTLTFLLIDPYESASRRNAAVPLSYWMEKYGCFLYEAHLFASLKCYTLCHNNSIRSMP